MVRLERITMQGFKSFAGKVSIPLPAGFNCICGPNGAGKSNIVDAITFVLGTSSAKSIRAQRLQNLLFNGGKDKKPADYCIVSFYLDNSDGKIVGYDKEVKISRRINRSGISTYKLNGKTVPKSKILDVLSSAGLSPDGYNIIKQGDITKIIEMSNIERREIIDEISGIREFDEKKEKAHKELQTVDEKVREMMIIVTEKEKLVERLKKEREIAKQYENLSKELRKAKASLAHKKLKKMEEEYEILNKKIDEKIKLLKELEKKYSDFEKNFNKKESRLREITDIIIKKSRDYQVSKKINELRTELFMKKDKLEMNLREIEREKNIQGLVKPAVKEILKLKIDGVFGTFLNLVNIPDKYNTAIKVAIGKHAMDVVVSDDKIASDCIKFLKKNKIGRARFIPLNKIHGKEIKAISKIGVLGRAIDLISYDSKFSPAVKYVLGSTYIVEDIDVAREIKERCVTLDGDIKESSGAMIGGFLAKKEHDNISKLVSENESLMKEIKTIEEEIKKLESLERKESEDIVKLQKEKQELEKELELDKSENKNIYESRYILQNEINNIKIEKAKLDAVIDNLKLENEEYKDVKTYFDKDENELNEMIRKYIYEINSLGPVNMKAIEEYEIINVEFEELKKKLNKLIEEKNAIEKTVNEIEKKRYDKFIETFNEISNNFSKVYKDLTGGTGILRLEEENNIDSGLIIESSPPGKKVLDIDSISGGEKSLTSLAFLFAIMQHYSAPFYVLDEVEAALDKVNTKKIAELIKKYSKDVQFIVITHNDTTISMADRVFGVSMENGVSKIFGIEMPKQ